MGAPRALPRDTPQPSHKKMPRLCARCARRSKSTLRCWPARRLPAKSCAPPLPSAPPLTKGQARNCTVHCKRLLIFAPLAALMLQAAGCSTPREIAPSPPGLPCLVPAALLAACPRPPALNDDGMDALAIAYKGTLDAWGECALLHAALVQAVEGAR